MNLYVLFVQCMQKFLHINMRRKGSSTLSSARHIYLFFSISTLSWSGAIKLNLVSPKIVGERPILYCFVILVGFTRPNLWFDIQLFLLKIGHAADK